MNIHREQSVTYTLQLSEQEYQAIRAALHFAAQQGNQEAQLVLIALNAGVAVPDERRPLSTGAPKDLHELVERTVEESEHEA